MSDELTLRDARRYMFYAVAISAASMFASAAIHYGFVTGDDVEIQEMTLGRVFGKPWPVWALRSASYPMAFIYPAQTLAYRLGITAPFALVLVGRAVVALLSSVAAWLVFQIARRSHSAAISIVSAIGFAFCRLHLQFGSTELPRPISTCFVLAAYLCLMNPTIRSGALGGALLAFGAALRFSEGLFLFPALVMLAIARQWKTGLVLVLAFAVTVCAIQGTADLLYWGKPFASVFAIVDFTLVKRLSSRGFQPPFFYVLDAPAWISLVTLGFACRGSLRPENRFLAAWAWIPLLCLSLLPHKESRYVLPILPFVVLLAASEIGLQVRRITQTAALASAMRASFAMCLCMVISIVWDLQGVHFARSEREIDVARRIVAEGPSPRLVAAEQAWRFGGNVYLQPIEGVYDFSVEDATLGDLWRHLSTDRRIDVLIISIATCDVSGCDDRARVSGFSEATVAQDRKDGYRVFTRL